MANSIYKINKGINKSIEFKGLKAQYIWYFGGGVIGLLIFFAVLYILGINTFICLGIIGIAGILMTLKIFRLSHTYGEHGMMKKIAGRRIPSIIKTHSRNIFLKTQKTKNEHRTR